MAVNDLQGYLSWDWPLSRLRPDVGIFLGDCAVTEFVEELSVMRLELLKGRPPARQKIIGQLHERVLEPRFIHEGARHVLVEVGEQRLVGLFEAFGNEETHRLAWQRRAVLGFSMYLLVDH